MDTVQAHVNGWIDYRLAVGTIRPSTARNYHIMLKPFLEALGSVKLSALGVDQCRAFVAQDAKANGLKMAKQRYIIAKAAITAAVKEGKIPTNPFSRFDPPKVSRKASKGTLDQSQLNELHAASYRAEEWKTGLAIRIAISTGLRRGELAALRWSDVEPGAIHVRNNAVRSASGFEIGEPKTEASIRKVSIPDLLSGELERLRGEPDGFVLDGIHPDTLSDRVGKLLPDGFSIHDIRHAHATALLQAGIPVKAVSRRLGHADVMTTMRVYAHAMPQDEQAAVDAINAVVGGPKLRVVS